MGIRDWFRQLWGHVEPDQVVAARITDEGFAFELADGEVRLLRWSELEQIDLHLVQGGGVGERIHFIFQAGELEARVARTAPGFRHIEDRLPQLPGFDQWTYARAMRHFQDMRTPIWRRDMLPDKRDW